MNAVAAPRGDAFLEFAAPGRRWPDVVVQVDAMPTVLTSFMELFGGLSRRLPGSIKLEARSADGDGSAAALSQLLGNGMTCPDFLSGTVFHGTFDEQVEQLRETPAEIVDHDLTTPWDPGGAAARRWRRQPERCLADCCRALTKYRRNVVDRLYPRLEQRLQRESARLEAGLAEYGHEIMLGLLHPRLRLESERLRLRQGHQTGVVRWQSDVLALKPMMCAAPATYFSNIGCADNPRVKTAFFAAAPPLLRAGWQKHSDRGDQGLDLLIGQPKAEVLRSLRRRPGTTSDLADELGLAPSTVSFHLKVLYGAGAISSSRRGGGVYYRVSERGQRLLEA